MDDEREGYHLAREAFTEKHLPLCEALELDDANDADKKQCACVYAAVWGREIRRTDDSAPEETRVPEQTETLRGDALFRLLVF